MLPRLYHHVTKALRGCYQGITRVSPRFYHGVTLSTNDMQLDQLIQPCLASLLLTPSPGNDAPGEQQQQQEEEEDEEEEHRVRATDLILWSVQPLRSQAPERILVWIPQSGTHALIFSKVCHQAKLDLAVVRGHQDISWLSNKSRPT